jgi:GcrA cell cycle regulator
VEGLSAGQISSELGGCTRNAVIGKIHRLGLSVKDSPHRKRSPKAPRKRRRVLTREATLLARLKKEALPPPAEDDVAEVPFKALEDHHCRWAVGEPQAAGTDAPLFCGAERVPGLPYCEPHVWRAYADPAQIIAAVRLKQPEKEFA